MAPRPGDVICGHLELDRLESGFGHPAFGPVWVALDQASGQTVWLTVIEMAFLPTQLDLSTLMAGAGELPPLRHPGLVRTWVVDREADYCVIGNELLPTATTVVDAVAEGQGATLLPKAARQMAQALAFLHRKRLVHGVLCPQNVAIWEGTAMMLQYGFAAHCRRAEFAVRYRRMPDQVGPPEARRGEPLTAVADVYAWGVVMATLATSTTGAESINTVIDGLGGEAHPGVMAVVRQALCRNPDERPRDGVQLMQLLAAAEAKALGRPDPLEPAAESSEALRVEEIEEIPAADPGPRTRSPSLQKPVARAAALSDLAAEVLGKREPSEIRELSERSGEQDIEEALHGLGSAGPPPGSDDPAVPITTADDEPDRSEPKPDLRRPVFRPPRRPGPHGPRSALWAWVAVVIAAGLAGWATWGAAQRHGSVAAMFARGSGPAPDPVAAAGPARPEVAQGSPPGPPAEGAAATDPQEPAPIVDAGCPAQMVTVSPRLCIDRGEFPGVGRMPRTGLRPDEAAQLCKNAGKRLCTPNQWQRACTGQPNHPFAYGPDPVAGRCNTATVAGLAQSVDVAGAWPQCTTDAGAVDMIGNAAEWVSGGTAMGGDVTTPMHRASCSARSRPRSAASGPRHVGFRCCLDPRTQR